MMFAEVNENDARVAMKVWAEAATSRKGLPTASEPYILRSQAETRRTVSNGLVDVITMTTWTR